MSARRDADVRDLGTRFLIFPQSPLVPGYEKPETVWLSPPAGSIGLGPADDQIYVLSAIDKAEPYDYPYLPPYRGRCERPPEPDLDGHFDHLGPDAHGFLAAHAYASLRRVLDVWESYLGRRIRWHFSSNYARLEVIPFINWDNAQSGYGYMEFGYDRGKADRAVPFALNFDVIAHETGHCILFGEMDVPPPGDRTLHFYAFHESCADLVALFSMLHFDTVADRLLRSTRGNLYTLNELNRIAELSDNRQIRIAGNARKLSETSDEVHDLSRPLTGAVFDILVDVFQGNLLERGLIGADLAGLSYRGDQSGQVLARLQRGFDAAYQNRHFAFKSALADARDFVGQCLAAVWAELPPGGLVYSDIAHAFLDVDLQLGQGRYQSEIEESFRWREII